MFSGLRGQQARMLVEGRKTQVESPLQQRDVQWTLVVFATIMLVSVMFSWKMRADIATDLSLPIANDRSDSITGARIDINQALAYELALLPGVGPVLANRIVEDRVQNGDFRSLDDLHRVHGVGEKTIDRIGPLCIVGNESNQRNASRLGDSASR